MQTQDLINAALSVRTPLRVTNTNDNGTGSLRQVISSAVAGDIVVFADTILPGTITLTSGPITINKAITILGPGVDKLTISGNNSSRIFIISGAAVTISGITFANGFDNVGSGGGAILNENGAILTLRNTSFNNNNAPIVGGAIANMASTANIENSTFTENSANFSGAIGNLSGTVNLRNSTLSNNSATVNGGAFANDGTANILNSTFRNNIAGNNGGAFANQGTATIINSTFINNIAGNNGGAVANINSGRITIFNSIFIGNFAVNRGGAVANVDSGTISITNSTFTNNVAGNNDGAIANIDGGTVNTVNNTFTNNIP